VPRVKKEVETKRRAPARTPEEQEDRMINLAMNLAEKQMREGTASSQVITEFLKRASKKERIEQEILEQQKELIKAKTEALKSAKKIEELYDAAITAFSSYNGQPVKRREDED
jgi:predicted nucleic acid-binding protein